MEFNLFVYGTLRKGYSNNRLINQLLVKNWVPDCYTHGRLWFAGSRNTFPYASFEPSIGNRIIGEVYFLNGPEEHVKKQIALLDYLEGFVPDRDNNHYIRKLVPVHIPNGNPLQVNMYVMPKDRIKDMPDSMFIKSGDWAKEYQR